MTASSNAPETNHAAEASRAHPHGLPQTTADHAMHGQVERGELLRIALVGASVVASFCGIARLSGGFDFVALIATLVGGIPIFQEALEALRERRMTMELSMTIALAAAVSIGEFFTAAVIVLFVLIAEMLEKMTVSRGRRAIKDLLSFLPQRAFIQRGTDLAEVAVSEVRRGDIVLVKPGARISVDGVVTAGDSFVDESTITGESAPVQKLSGAHVFAGTMNQSGALYISTETVGEDTAFGKILHVVEEAENSQAKIEQTADRLAGYLVYFAIGCAIFTFLLTHNIRSTISVVIVAGACGIAAGTPLAILGAIGQSARKGVIAKGGIYIEQLSAVDTVVFDKTGTLTVGKPHVIDVKTVDGVTKERLLALAASAEKLSEHPLSAAIQRAAAESGIATVVDPSSFEYMPGLGVSASVNGNLVNAGSASFLRGRSVVLPELISNDCGSTVIHVSCDGDYFGAIAIADRLRPDAASAVSELKQLGLHTFLFTGDSQPVASAIAREAGIDQVFAELLPEEKARRIAEMKLRGAKIAMVGDGINDAPALITADVGVAVGSGTDVALESADIMLITNELERFVDAVKIARRCRRIIMTNFIGTLLVDGLGIALAAVGVLSPVLAAFIHVTSELLFIFNSARLLPALNAGSKFGSTP